MRFSSWVVVFIGCAPSAHESAAVGAALAPTTPAARRAVVASTLQVTDPLEAPACALPTSPGSPCLSAPSESRSEPEAVHRNATRTEAAQPFAARGPAVSDAPPSTEPLESHNASGRTAVTSKFTAPSAARPAADAGALGAAAPSTVKDPVCGMTIDPVTAKGGSAVVGGKTFHFCSTSCRRTFLARDGGTP